jgi:hypothetical protein
MRNTLIRIVAAGGDDRRARGRECNSVSSGGREERGGGTVGVAWCIAVTRICVVNAYYGPRHRYRHWRYYR